MIRIRSTAFFVGLLLLGMSHATPAAASPITVTFSGRVGLIDFEWVNKDLCADLCEVVAAFANAGFYNGAPLSLSLTFNDQMPVSADGSIPPVGVRGSLSISQHVYDVTATTLAVGGGGFDPNPENRDSGKVKTKRSVMS